MNTKRVAILGAGISGLSAAHFLKTLRPDVECVLFEKEERVGGVIQSSREDGIFFEHGPRTFATNRTPQLLALIKDMGLEDDIHFSSARNRYVLHDGNVRKIPDNIVRLLFSPFGKGIIPAIFKDLRHPPGLIPDETIESFILRHGNKNVLEQIIDPMVMGIFAGDTSKLSVGACFPSWKRFEYKHGSIIKGVYKTKNKSTLPPLYTLKDGMHSLPEKLAASLPYQMRLNTHVESIIEKEGGVEINGEFFDHALVCLPSKVASSMLPEKYFPFFQGIEHITLNVVNVAFENVSVPKDGFGYLAPTKERADIFGVVFDSSVFPEHHMKDYTRLTVMLPGDDNLESRALSALRSHLKITKDPLQVKVRRYQDYLPQLLVGHLERRDHLAAKHLSFVGNYLHSVSVESCIVEAEKAVKALSL